MGKEEIAKDVTPVIRRSAEDWIAGRVKSFRRDAGAGRVSSTRHRTARSLAGLQFSLGNFVQDAMETIPRLDAMDDW